MRTFFFEVFISKFISDREKEPDYEVYFEKYPKFPETSCYGRCNHHNKVTCQCDAYCKHAGDCCMDYDETCQNEKVKDNSTMYECTDVYGLQDMGYALLVTRCSPSWNVSYIASRCATKSNAKHVYDRRGVNYHNIYCAICNYIHPKQVYMWGLGTDTVCNKMLYGSQIRQCRNYSLCPDSYINKSRIVAENCTSYLYPLLCIDGVHYKNPYCRCALLSIRRYLDSAITS